MSKFKKHKKLLYVPGMFSLLVIPLAFIFYASILKTIQKIITE